MMFTRIIILFTIVISVTSQLFYRVDDFSQIIITYMYDKNLTNCFYKEYEDLLMFKCLYNNELVHINLSIIRNSYYI